MFKHFGSILCGKSTWDRNAISGLSLSTIETQLVEYLATLWASGLRCRLGYETKHFSMSERRDASSEKDCLLSNELHRDCTLHFKQNPSIHHSSILDIECRCCKLCRLAGGSPTKEAEGGVEVPNGKVASQDTRQKGCKVAAALQRCAHELFASRAFGKWLRRVTDLGVVAMQGQLRRFRPGLDYTVATGVLASEGAEALPRLDATLCFVDDEAESDALAWQSGEVGGFQCYIVADEEANAAAETYR
jgi:hypothetical protein